MKSAKVNMPGLPSAKKVVPMPTADKAKVPSQKMSSGKTPFMSRTR